jgi:uncharacterized protein YjiS (DUF1127 family)
MFHLNRDIYGFIQTASSRFCPEQCRSDLANGAGGEHRHLRRRSRAAAQQGAGDNTPETTMAILTTRSPDTAATDPWIGLVRKVAAWPAALITGLMVSWHHRATVKTLRELDDHTLRDIGLTRADIEDALRERSSADRWTQL